MAEWRKHGPLGVLIDIINYIKTPQQYDLFRDFQHTANRELPASEQYTILELVKPVVTRWNSFLSAFKRAVKLHSAFNAYASYYVNTIADANAIATVRGNKPPDVPTWIRSGGLSAADWAVITEYINVL